MMEFDFVIVGGGSAGAILARRLADADIGTVALIEAGQIDENIPAFLDISRLDEQASDTDWGFRAATSPGGDHHLDYARARVLGGCGTHNDCAFLQPPDSDFEHWETLGARGWGPDAVRPYFARIEQRVRVEDRPATHPVTAAFLRAGIELGLPEVPFRRRVAPGVGMLSLNAIGTSRQSSSVAYLHPLRHLPRNLTVLTEVMATKIQLADGAAVGAATTSGLIRARVEVILAAGSIQSPQLLMVSGIGDPRKLKSVGIEPLHALLGVGSNLADHSSAAVIFQLREPVPPWDVTPYESVMMLRLRRDAPAPDILGHFGLRLGRKFCRVAQPDSSLTKVAGRNNLVDLSPNVTRPRSRGEVTVRSADMRDPPVIHLNYFSDPEGHDVQLMTEALRFCRRFAGTPAFQRLGASIVEPGTSVQTDEEFAGYIRSSCETVYHAAGTCRMGHARDERCVVTPDLRVRGIDRLRVCDASVFPTMLTVNINNAVMMIAEKAADLILADHRPAAAAAALAAL